MKRPLGLRSEVVVCILLALVLSGFNVPAVRGEQGLGKPEKKAAGDTASRDPYCTAVQYLEEAKVLIKKKEFQRAVDLLRKAVALAPQDGAFHHHLGYALWGLRRFGPAEEEFETALKLDSSNVFARYFLGRIAFTRGEFERAIQFYERVAASEVAVFDTSRRLTQAYLRNGEATKALQGAQDALRQAPWDGALHFQLAKIYQGLNRHREAQQEFEAAERLKRADQESVKKLLKLSQAIRQQDVDEVRRLRRELLELSAQDPEILTPLGLLLGRGGMYSESVGPLERAVEANPASYEAHINLGLSLSRLNHSAGAVSSLEMAVKLRPDSFEANSILAVLYIAQNKNPEAIERLRAANRVRPEHLKVLGLVGQQYLEGRYYREAVESFRQLVRLKPQEVKWRYLLIHAFNANGKYKEALYVARETAELFPSEARSHLEVGLQMCNLGHYKAAFPYVRKALDIDPSYVKAYNTLGDLQSRQGDYEGSRMSFERATNLDPRDADARKGLGDSLIRLIRYEEALGELQSAVQVHPRVAKLYLLLSQVHARLGNREEAARNAEVFTRLHKKESRSRDQKLSRRFVPKEPHPEH